MNILPKTMSGCWDCLVFHLWGSFPSYVNNTYGVPVMDACLRILGKMYMDVVEIQDKVNQMVINGIAYP